MLFLFFFFFQAEDGIRDPAVTGVQTCALPISSPGSYLARSKPSQNGWPRGTGSNQGGCQPENDPYSDPDHIRGGSGYCEKLSTSRELLPQQARAVGRVRESCEEHQ